MYSYEEDSGNASKGIRHLIQIIEYLPDSLHTGKLLKKNIRTLSMFNLYLFQNIMESKETCHRTSTNFLDSYIRFWMNLGF